MYVQQSPGQPEFILPPLERSEFDFVVAERPKYIPNSGPPLEPISLLPDNEKNGIILTSFEANHRLVYVISWDDAPHLRMTAHPETILDYVSPRTYEEFECQQYLEREGFGPGRGKASKGTQDAAGARDDGEPKQKGKPGRKRKHALIEGDAGNSAAGRSRIEVRIGPGAARKPIEEPEPVFTSPQRPTLMSPSKQRGLADMVESEESEEEEELPTDIAIEAQLNSTMRSRSQSRLRNTVSRSPSPEPPTARNEKTKASDLSLRDTRSSSTQNRGSSSRSVSVSTSVYEAKRQKRSVRNDSVASMSGLGAGKLYGELERSKSKVKSRTPSRKPSPSEKSSSVAKSKKRETTSVTQEAATQSKFVAKEELGEDEYEVEAILDEVQYSVGKKSKRIVTYYLIKWVGNWPLSWEPAENVGRDSVEDYEINKTLGLIVVGEAGAAFDAAIEAEAEKHQTPKHSRREGGLMDEDHDKLTESAASGFKPSSQGQVIDDDDGSEYDSD